MKRQKDVSEYILDRDCDLTEEIVSLNLEKNGIQIAFEKDEQKGKLVGTVSKVLEHVEADRYSDELLVGLLNKYFNNGENHRWVVVE